MSALEWWEGASYVVTVSGRPLALAIFIDEQRRSDFREGLPTLLEGEAEDFMHTIPRIREEAAARAQRGGQ